jgi:hypothetical protein
MKLSFNACTTHIIFWKNSHLLVSVCYPPLE